MLRSWPRVAEACLVLAALVFGGMAPGPASACETEVLARLVLTLRGGHVFTDAVIDGAAVTMLVDTGAAVSALDRAVAERLHLPQDRARNAATIGIDGRIAAAVPILAIKRLDLGPLALQDLTMVRGDFARGRPAASQIEGILGADVLARYDVEIDVARGAMTLHRVKDCAGSFIGWPAGASVVPLRPVYDARLKSSAVTIDGRQLTALLDTGATQSVLFAAGTRRLGEAARRGPADRSGFGVGSTGGRRLAVRLHPFGSLRLGDVAVAGPVLAIAPTSPLDLDMVVGLDVLGRRRFWLSYATDQLFLAPP